jgi:hypothetical protein
MNQMGIVTVVNRTLEPLEGRWDGIPIDLPPGYRQREDGTIEPAGENGQPRGVQLLLPAARIVKAQHPQMGTADPDYPLDMEYLVGIVEEGDDISYVPPTEAVELLNRSLITDADAQGAVVVGVGAPSRRNRKRMLGSRNRNAVLKTKVDY